MATLKKVDKATDLPPIEQLRKAWVAADAEQKRLQNAISTAVEALRAAMVQINAGRRDIQAGADNVYPYTDAANEPERRAFKLPVNRPFSLSAGPA